MEAVDNNSHSSVIIPVLVQVLLLFLACCSCHVRIKLLSVHRPFTNENLSLSGIVFDLGGATKKMHTFVEVLPIAS